MMAKITMPSSRWPAVANPILAQLLCWRPVPGYHPSAEALAPALLIIDLLRSALADAPAHGQVHPDAATGAGMELLPIMHGGFARDFAIADGQRVI